MYSVGTWENEITAYCMPTVTNVKSLEELWVPFFESKKESQGQIDLKECQFHYSLNQASNVLFTASLYFFGSFNYLLF